MSIGFYSKQSNLTAAKIEIFQSYIEVYLAILLSKYKECFIFDLFCGNGKNGTQNGSPLALIEKANYILTASNLKNKDVAINILFNDENKKCIDNLNAELKKIKKNNKINIFTPENKIFEDIFCEIIKLSKNNYVPKFFFLDPFTYSDIKMTHLKSIMNLKNTEILLFSPVFFSYRFASNKKLKDDHKTKVFVTEFTTKGMHDYKGNKEDINDFMISIKEKIRQELNLDFVRKILLDDGARKNALFLLTRNIKGMQLMNKIMCKKSESGQGINIKENKRGQKTLFGIEGTGAFMKFSADVEKNLKGKKEVTNKEILHFTAMEEFRPQDVKILLKKFYDDKKIKIFDKGGKEISNFNKCGIGADTKLETIFKYI